MAKQHFAIVLPVFDDWVSLGGVLKAIDQIAMQHDFDFSVYVINDGSIQPIPETLRQRGSFPNLRSVAVIDLVCNMGHQRAIAIGLAKVVQESDCSAVIVMDADGEDDPRDLTKLIGAHFSNPEVVVLAHRAGRSEGRFFRFSYVIYKIIFRVLSGYAISFGNYSLIPAALARRIIYKANLWNSLPATVLLSKIPYAKVETYRAKRLDGFSKMNLIGLILHGLQAIAVFSDTVVVRLALLLGGIISAAIVGIVMLRLLTDILVPGWASSMIAFLVLVGLQLVFLMLNTTLVVLQSRTLKQQIPALDFAGYVRELIWLMPPAK